MATTFTNQAALSYNGTQVLSNIAVGVLEGTISVTKNAVADTYAQGDVITYIVSIVNSGDTAVSGLTVSDDLGAYPFGTGTVQPLSYVAGSAQYYSDGVRQSDPAVSTADGLAITGISVPAQGNATVVYSAAVNEYAPLAEGSDITNTVTVSGSGVSEAQAQATITAVTEAQLSVVKSVSPIPVSENGRLTYTFQLLNSGNTAVADTDGATVSDTFDPVLTDITVALDSTLLTSGDYSYVETTGVFATTAGVLAIPAATYTQDPTTGEITVTPGSATLTVTGNVGAV